MLTCFDGEWLRLLAGAGLGSGVHAKVVISVAPQVHSEQSRARS